MSRISNIANRCFITIPKNKFFAKFSEFTVNIFTDHIHLLLCSVFTQTIVLAGHIDSWDVGQGAMDDAAGAILGWQVSVQLT